MLFLAPADLRGLDASALDDLVARSELTVAAGEGEVTGLAAAALLFSDYAVLREGSSLGVDTAEGWAGAAWRIGRRVLKIGSRLDAAEAREHGLCDELFTTTAEEWLARWMRGRSALALDAAAMLIRSRGGDRLERAEFARLFAIGEPQKGLGAFLAKRDAGF
jgi:enoyl-CoA hydratase/carnithine racemase